MVCKLWHGKNYMWVKWDVTFDLNWWLSFTLMSMKQLHFLWINTDGSNTLRIPSPLTALAKSHVWWMTMELHTEWLTFLAWGWNSITRVQLCSYMTENTWRLMYLQHHRGYPSSYRGSILVRPWLLHMIELCRVSIPKWFESLGNVHWNKYESCVFPPEARNENSHWEPACECLPTVLTWSVAGEKIRNVALELSAQLLRLKSNRILQIHIFFPYQPKKHWCSKHILFYFF